MNSTTCSDSFTLSEVLVTLGIIGIVAGITLPAVIKNYKKKEAEVRLQKAYTIISQAFLRAQVKYGETKDWPDWDDAEKILREYIAPELSGAKIYSKSNTTDRNLMCFDGKLFDSTSSSGNAVKAQYRWMTNVYISTPFLPNNTASVKLTDGTCIGLNNKNGGIDNSQLLFIDTNGSSQGPNIAGHDLFFFVVVENNIKPVGYDWNNANLTDSSKTHACNLKSLAGGMVCAAKVMADGWKINYW